MATTHPSPRKQQRHVSSQPVLQQPVSLASPAAAPVQQVVEKKQEQIPRRPASPCKSARGNSSIPQELQLAAAASTPSIPMPTAVTKGEAEKTPRLPASPSRRRSFFTEEQQQPGIMAAPSGFALELPPKVTKSTSNSFAPQGAQQLQPPPQPQPQPRQIALPTPSLLAPAPGGILRGATTKTPAFAPPARPLQTQSSSTLGRSVVSTSWAPTSVAGHLVKTAAQQRNAGAAGGGTVPSNPGKGAITQLANMMQMNAVPARGA